MTYKTTKTAKKNRCRSAFWGTVTPVLYLFVEGIKITKCQQNYRNADIL